MKLRFKVLGVGACLAMATAGLGVGGTAGAKPLGATKGSHTQTYGTYVDFSGGTYPDGAWGIGQIYDTTQTPPLTTDACLVLPLSTDGTSLTGNHIQGIDDPAQPNPGSKPGTWHIAYGTTAPYTSGELDVEALTEALGALTATQSCVPNNTPATVAVSFLSATGQITFTEASSSNVINGIAEISNGQEQVVAPCNSGSTVPTVDTVAYSSGGTGSNSYTNVTWGTKSAAGGTCTWPFTTAAKKQPTISKPQWDNGATTTTVCGGAGAPRNIYDTEGVSNSSSNPAMTYSECQQDSTKTNLIKSATETVLVTGLNAGDEAYVQQVRTNVTTTAQYTQVGPEMTGTGVAGNKIPAGKCKMIANPTSYTLGVPQHYWLQCDGWASIPFTIVSRWYGTSDGAGLTDTFGLLKPKVDTVVCAIQGSAAKPGDCSE